MRVENIMSNWFLSVNKSDTASSCRGRQRRAAESSPGIQGTAGDPTGVLATAYRSDHFTDEDGRGPPVVRGARDEPLAVELQEELRAGVDVHTSTMLPVGLHSSLSYTCSIMIIKTANESTKTDLELMGDNGGDVGAGASPSSSSSSPHSSSLSGVMLFPSHTEWMDTWEKVKAQDEVQTWKGLLPTSLARSASVQLLPVPVCSPCCPSPARC